MSDHNISQPCADTSDVRPRAALRTVGCKVNQFETEQMRELLEAAGYWIVPWGTQAELYVVNSCTVTAEADRDTRRLARFAKRLNPNAKVVVVGCCVDASPEQLRAMSEVDLLVNNKNKSRLLELIAETGAHHQLPSPALPDYAGTGPMITRFSSHTRAFVKVHEGCSSACAYCIVPRARGAPRSVPPQIVEQQVRKLVRSGHMEIVLVGTHLGRYGADLDQKTDLLHLLRRLACVDGLGRLRLSSLEPQEVAPALIEALADGGSALDPHADRLACKGKLCRHLHIPLQSGSDDVLRAMGRPYDTEFYARLLQQLVAQVPGICIGADCIVGFPGETDDHFAQTLTFVRSLPLAYLHVFTFSPRAGTRAAALDGQVPADEMQARNHVLRNLSLTKSVHFAQTQLGQVLEVIPERRNPAGYLQSLSDNYLRVQHSGPDLLLGRLVRVRILQACGQTLFGETANQGDTAA